MGEVEGKRGVNAKERPVRASIVPPHEQRDHAGTRELELNALQEKIVLGESGFGSCTSTQYCGDGAINGNEACDGNSQSCTTTSGYPGTQICNGQCSGFGSCTSTQYCGDGICNGAETSSSCSQDCHANSCSDTDGGFSIRWRGTVSGYYNNASYNYTDYCQSSALLNEYFCSSNTSNSSAYNCSSINSTAYCSNGGCN